jgi:hypothetical protein
MRLGIADHFGWAIAVTAFDDHKVVDRRRIELVEPGITPAPIHHESHRPPRPEAWRQDHRARRRGDRTTR